MYFGTNEVLIPYHHEWRHLEYHYTCLQFHSHLFYRFMALWRLITDLVRFWQNLICLLSLWAKPFCPLRGIHQYDFQLAWYVSIINSLVCQFVSVAITELLPFECPPGRSFTLLQNYTQKDCYRLKIIILTYGDDSWILKCDITFSCLSPYRIT